MISFSKIYHIMGLSCSGAICGLGWDGLDGLDLCAGLLYEHRFAMLIRGAPKRFPLTNLGFCPNQGGGGGRAKPPFFFKRNYFLWLDKND